MKQLKNFPTPIHSTSQTASGVFKWFVIDRTLPGTAIPEFILPADLIPVHVTIQSFSGAASNAGTTATLSLGFKGGTGSELVASADVKNNVNQITTPSLSSLVVASPSTPQTWADRVITATYAETGTASSAGGPWLVAVDFMSNPYR